MVGNQLLVPNEHHERNRSSSMNDSTANGNDQYEIHPCVSTGNIYEELMHDEPISTGPQESELRQPSAAKIRCPPIFVYNWSVAQINQLMSSTEVNSKTYTQKVIKSGIRLQVKEKAEFNRIVAVLKVKNVKFYTHGTSDETPIRVVLAGLPLFELQEVITELKNNNIVPSEVRILHTTKNRDVALYVLHFPKGSTKLQDLQKTRALFNVIVNWRYFTRKTTDAVQCFRCQQFGHGMRNCNLEAKCVKCGELHLTRDCLLPSREEGDDSFTRTQIRCANCSQNHTANFKGCPARQNYIKMSEERKSRSKLNNNFPSNVFGTTNRSFRSSYVTHNRTFSDAARGAPVAAAAVGNVSSVAAAAVGGVSAVVESMGHVADNERTENLNLFSLSEFLCLANDLFTHLASCKTKASQFLALSELMFKYVFNG